MRKLLGEWNEAGRLADATPRIVLAPQVAKLQAIKRRAEQLSTHACATNLQAAFVRWKPICFGTWLLGLYARRTAILVGAWDATLRLVAKATDDGAMAARAAAP